MGFFRNELVLFETYDEKDTEKTREAVEKLRAEMPAQFRPLVVGPLLAPVNGAVYWAMFPDGSKEWWATSDQANVWRAKFKALAKFPESVVHVTWGDNGPEIAQGSWSSSDGEPEVYEGVVRDVTDQRALP